MPLVPLKIAAGAFSDPQKVDEKNFESVQFKTKHKLRRGMFVAQVVGESMEPLIADGSYLFKSPVTGTRQVKIVLVERQNGVDLDTGERYTLKQYQSDKVRNGDSWKHQAITLKPISPAFSSIVLTATSNEGRFVVVAEFVEKIP